MRGTAKGGINMLARGTAKRGRTGEGGAPS